MTLSRRQQLHIVTATLGVFIAGALLADRTLAQAPCSFGNCPTMTLTANLQLTNLHSAVTYVQINCRAMLSGGFMSGATSARATVVKSRLYRQRHSQHPGPAESACGSTQPDARYDLSAGVLNGTSTMAAVASATQPLGMLPDNWHVVAAGSKVTWNQAVTFPNANVP